MSRLRATTAPTEADRIIAGHLDRAGREIEQALGKARDGGLTGGYRQRRVERELGRVLAAIQDVGTIGPRFGGNDPDLIPEEERIAQFRAKKDEERAERKAARNDEVSS